MNGNMKVMKKAGEERYFKNFREFAAWYGRQAGGRSFDELIDACERFRKQEQWPVSFFEQHFPTDDGATFRVYGDNHWLVYTYCKGRYVRRSGTYTINVVASDTVR